MAAKIVLIVEDDAFLLNILKAKFEAQGYQVRLAQDGVAALEAAKKERPALILLDLMLPKKNGFEFLEDISKDSTLKSIPVVIISNLGQAASIERGKALGAREYFVKSELSIDGLAAKVKEHLRQK
jgi:two-component system alkaline phosphatase synthesis response regulator PhoP